MMTDPMNLQIAQKLYSNFLNKEKMFFTKERKIILKAVFEMSQDHFSVDEFLYEITKLNYKVSRATVYRALSQLAQAGVLNEADFGHGHMHYELVGDDDHEHIICKQCQKVIEVDSEEVTNAIRKLVEA
ncbi:MAG: transcriptional repressor, partial [Burkholderiales bacterium]|nr:transcriptional repressor [Burkholderiales bacterium]